MGKIENVALILREIRDKEKHDRKDCCTRLLDKLGHKKNTSVSLAKFDALLIKATIECFDVSPKSDIVLMAFGLLKGYEYQRTTISARRRKYLRESNYLQTNSRSKIKKFDEATEDEQEQEIKNIRNGGEARPINSLAEFLLKQNIEEYIKHLDDYITKGKNPSAILPKPSYSLSDSSDKTEPPSADPKAEVRHVKNFNRNRNENTTVVKVINIIGGDNSSKPKCPSGRDNDAVGITRIEGVSVWIKQNKATAVFITVLCCALLISLPFAWQHNQPSTSTDAQIKVPEGTITMQPGGAYKMSPVLLSGASMEMEDAEFSYISSNPNIVQVLQSGLLRAQNELADGASVSAEITIQGPDNVTQKITVTVEKSASSDVLATIDKNDFGPAYNLETQVRLVGGDKTWGNSIDAKVGDKVEFRLAYKNNDTVDQTNVMIKDILPAGLRYIPGSTKLVNGTYPNGATIDQDNIITRGINIGGYGAGANAFVRFQAEVVDEQLEPYGNTGLVNWAQAGVGKATIQDYATVRVIKD